jgi:hypothetical protein
MTLATPFPPGQGDWSGENPGIYLKESADGRPWTTLSRLLPGRRLPVRARCTRPTVVGWGAARRGFTPAGPAKTPGPQRSRLGGPPRR